MVKEIFTVRTEGEFESAHSLRNYIEKEPETFVDEPVHGHTWKAEVFIESNNIDERTGFAIDFLLIKKKVDELCLYLDHNFINQLDPFDRINPSTENIAKWFYEKIESVVPFGCLLKKVIIWEGPHNYVIYEKVH
ncbi:MAG: 6-pyruvoyl tetrahydropterin synthase family protein [Candidatus Thorarchaeota archaeon]